MIMLLEFVPISILVVPALKWIVKEILIAHALIIYFNVVDAVGILMKIIQKYEMLRESWRILIWR